MKFSGGLRGRLLVSHLAVAAATLGTVLIGVSVVGPGYFAEAMGHVAGDPHAPVMDALTLGAFSDAMRTALLAGGLSALAAAVGVSLAMSARLASPISRLAAAAHRIALGHYAERVPSVDAAEVGELAAAFNTMSASLEDDERRRLQLVGDVAHELRTPLSIVDGYLEGLQDGVIEATPATWQLMRRETGRLNRLVGDLAELWRAEARQLPLAITHVPVRAVLDELRERFAPEASLRGMVIEVAEGCAVTVAADRDRLVQVLANYVSNALRYAPDRSTVCLAADESGSRVRIAVGDDGPGLTAEQLAHLYERFYRPDHSRSRALGGSGIGLAISRALAEAMQGQVWAESDGPGRGSRFFVALPAA